VVVTGREGRQVERRTVRPSVATADHHPPRQIGALVRVVDPAAPGGAYYCPDGRMEFKGHPVRRESSAESHDRELQGRLWQESERLTGVRFSRIPRGG
jgi:hypothetical protein